MKKIISVVLAAALMIAYIPLSALAAEPTYTKDVEVIYPVTGATGVDLNLRLNPLFVQKAEVIGVNSAFSNALYAYNQNGAKLKIAISSAEPMTCTGALCTLRLTLTGEPQPDDELFKLLQVKINEKIAWQADDCILLSGVADGKIYNRTVYAGFNEGTATLNGSPYASLSPIQAEGEYALDITDLNGKVRSVKFAIDKTPPAITVSPFDDVSPIKAPLTVTATVNEGTLNAASHTFEQNGSFTFSAVDAAGNRSEKTVTVSNLYRSFTITPKGIPENLTVKQGAKLDISGWALEIAYDNGMRAEIPIAEDMLDYSTAEIGEQTLTITCDDQTAAVPFTVIPPSVTETKLIQPTKLTYVEAKDSFNPAGGKIVITYENGKVEEIALTSDMVSGFDNTKLGEQTLTVTYGEWKGSFTVVIEKAEVKPPNPPANNDGPAVIDGKTVIYKDGKLVGGTLVVIVGANTYAVVNGFVSTAAGNHTVTVGGVLYIADKNGVIQKASIAQKYRLVAVGRKKYIVSVTGAVQKPKKGAKYRLIKLTKSSRYIVTRSGAVKLGKKKPVKVTIGKKSYLVTAGGKVKLAKKGYLLVKISKKVSYIVNNNGIIQKNKRVKIKRKRYTADKRGIVRR